MSRYMATHSSLLTCFFIVHFFWLCHGHDAARLNCEAIDGSRPWFLQYAVTVPRWFLRIVGAVGEKIVRALEQARHFYADTDRISAQVECLK